jgi:hypothetical protein
VTTAVWRACSSCKKSILVNSKYFVCSVSTCNGQRTGYVFCSVSCFEVHLPSARHKDAAAIEMRSGPVGALAASAGLAAAGAAPSTTGKAVVSSVASGAPAGSSPAVRRIVASPSATTKTTSVNFSSAVQSGSARPSASTIGSSNDVLIIASRLKDYIQAQSEMNTSASVMDILSQWVRVAADRAIENARADGRKTVMDRDFSFLREK